VAKFYLSQIAFPAEDNLKKADQAAYAPCCNKEALKVL
jgi:hypothetical protein